MKYFDIKLRSTRDPIEYKDCLFRNKIPIMKIRWSWVYLYMGIPTLNRHLNIDTAQEQLTDPCQNEDGISKLGNKFYWISLYRSSIEATFDKFVHSNSFCNI